MARKTKPLTDTEIRAAKSKDADYLMYDGDGLSLLVKSSGSKLWQFRYYRPFIKNVLSRVLEPTPRSRFLKHGN